VNQVERFFLQRYVQEPKRNLLRFSFVFMVLGIVLSVGILTAALNLFEGYERALKSALLDSFPHISIQAVYSQHLDPQSCETARQALAERAEISLLTPKLTFNLMAYSGNKVRGGLVNAYAWKRGGRVNYAKYVKKGKASQVREKWSWAAIWPGNWDWLWATPCIWSIPGWIRSAPWDCIPTIIP